MGGTWCSLLHIGTPLPQNLLQFLYLVYLYFIVLYFLFVRILYPGIHNLNIPSIVWCSMPSACEAILCTKSTASIQLFSKVHLNEENCWSGCFRASRPNPRLTIRAACLGPSLLLTYILLPRQPPGYTPAHSCAIFFVIWVVKYSL